MLQKEQLVKVSKLECFLVPERAARALTSLVLAIARLTPTLLTSIHFMAPG
jgi:hypothetical protein